MATKQNPFRVELLPLINFALTSGHPSSLENYLVAHGKISPSMLNLPMMAVFADLMGEIAVERVEECLFLLDQWAVLSAEMVVIGDAREILPTVAICSFGQIAACVTSKWDGVVARLYRAAGDSRWRMREMVAAGFQRMLAVNWARTIDVLRSWMMDADPLVIRAIAAAVAEPPLLKTVEHGEEAVALQAKSIDWFMAVPRNRRKEEHVRVLRQGLGYTVSVAAVASPDSGFALLEKMANSDDPDIQWIVRENLKKHRLQKWPDRVDSLRTRIK